MYLEGTPADSKLWRFKYRIDGREKRIGLGKYPDVGLKDARERREDARKLLANGVDPSLQRQAIKAAAVLKAVNTFETVAREWYLRYSPNWAASHSKTVLRRLERDIFPWMGDRAISEITAPQLLAVIRQIEGRGAFGRPLTVN